MTMGGSLATTGVEEIDPCLRALPVVLTEGAEILDTLAAQTPFLMASYCESLL